MSRRSRRSRRPLCCGSQQSARPALGEYCPGEACQAVAPCCVLLFCVVAATTAGPRPSLAFASARSYCRCSAASRAFFRVEAPAAGGADAAPCSVLMGLSTVSSTRSRSSSSTVESAGRRSPALVALLDISLGVPVAGGGPHSVVHREVCDLGRAGWVSRCAWASGGSSVAPVRCARSPKKL